APSSAAAAAGTSGDRGRSRTPAAPVTRAAPPARPPPCDHASAHRPTSSRRGRAADGPTVTTHHPRPSPRIPHPAQRRAPPQSPAPPPPVRATNSYARAELVACTVRVGCGGTSSRGGLARAPTGAGPAAPPVPRPTHAPRAGRARRTHVGHASELVPPRRARSVHRTSWVRG